MDHHDQFTDAYDLNSLPDGLRDLVYANSFGQRLREERARLRMKQNEMAEAGGVTRTTEHIYEQDIRAPDLTYLPRLRKVGADLSYLVLGVRQVNEAPDVIPMNPKTITNIYRLVDEVCVDRLGRLLPLESRVRVLQILCASMKVHGATSKNLEDLRAGLAGFRSGEDLPPG